MTLWLPCVPPKTSHHRKKIIRIGGRGGRLALADMPTLNRAKTTLEALLAPHCPATPLSGPVALSLVFIWPWVSSDRTGIKQHATNGRVWHDRRPDLSNLVKTIEDRMVRLGFMLDDGQVVQLQVKKFRGDTPGIWVQLEPAPAEGWEL